MFRSTWERVCEGMSAGRQAAHARGGLARGNNVCLIKQELFCGPARQMDAGYSKPKCLPPLRSFKLRLSASFAAGRGRNSEHEGTRKSGGASGGSARGCEIMSVVRSGAACTGVDSCMLIGWTPSSRPRQRSRTGAGGS